MQINSIRHIGSEQISVLTEYTAYNMCNAFQRPPKDLKFKFTCVSRDSLNIAQTSRYSGMDFLLMVNYVPYMDYYYSLYT